MIALAGCHSGRGIAAAAAQTIRLPRRLLSLLRLLRNLRSRRLLFHFLRTRSFNINVLPVWKQGIGGKSITVAVLDDGLDIEHENLQRTNAQGLRANYFSPD